MPGGLASPLLIELGMGHRPLLALLVFTAASCAPPDESPERVTTRISGSAYLDGPIEHARGEVCGMIEGEKGESLASATTTVDGTWATELGPYTGPVLVEVELGGSR